ncbi:hypothetical protein GCM10010191_46580 [Actinomadura vinacea]|uniref:DUF397 domain-containing protein n=1 Tax=Actinomadura vinacea TaxID=115336 RepID=A0ABP5WM73_9ACTN
MFVSPFGGATVTQPPTPRRWKAAGEGRQAVRDCTPGVEAPAKRGMAFERLDQLALEHLYGAR